MTRLARYEHGIPLVSGDTEREARFPSPDTNQRIENIGSGFFERWDGTSWLRERPTENVAILPAPPSTRPPSLTRASYEPITYTTTTATNILGGSNSNFASGDLTSWTFSDAAHTAVVTADGQNWAKIGPDATASSSLTSATGTIPSSWKGKDVEVSMLVAGYAGDISVHDQDGNAIRYYGLNAKLPATSAPVRLRFIVPWSEIAADTGLKIRFAAPSVTLAVAAEAMYVSEVMIAVADKRTVPLGQLGLSATGITFNGWDSDTEAAWLGSGWSEASARLALGQARQLGGTIKVWFGADALSTFNGSGVWQSFDPTYVANVDRFVTLCERYGLNVIATIVSQTSWTGVSHFESIVTDSAVRAGYVDLCEAFVARYKSYRAIVAWEPVGEGIDMLVSHLSGSTRATAKLAAREFMESVYDAIKAEDPNRPVLATFGSPDVIYPLIQPADYCDAVGYSMYYGSIAGGTASILTQKPDANHTHVCLDYLLGQSLPFLISECGAPIEVDAGTGTWAYRTPTINDDFLAWYLENAYAYGAEAVLPFRDKDVLWTRVSLSFGADGRVVQSAAASLPARTEITQPKAYQIANTAVGNLTATNVQEALAELDTDVAAKVQKAGDTMTGALTLADGSGVASVNEPNFHVERSVDVNGAALGTYDFRGGMPSAVNKNRVGARIKAQATGNWATSDDSEYAPTRLDLATQGSTGADRLGTPQVSIADGEKLSFHGAAPITKPAVAGSRGGNAALAALLTALANLGLITDNTTA